MASAQLLLHEADPIARAEGQDFIVEVVARRMNVIKRAIRVGAGADENEGPRARVQHEREILRARHQRRLSVHLVTTSERAAATAMSVCSAWLTGAQLVGDDPGGARLLERGLPDGDGCRDEWRSARARRP